MRKIFVSNIPESYTEKDLDLIFSTFGVIKTLKLHKDKKPYGFIEYENSECCSKAIQSLRGRILPGCSEAIKVEKAVDKNRRVIVTGIPTDTDENEIIKFLDYYGKIDNIEIGENKIHVDFRDKTDLENFLDLNLKIKYPNEKDYITIMPYTKKIEQNEEDNDDKCIFIYNLPQPFTNTDLKEIFIKYGKIVSSNVLSGGKGYVTFERTLSALKAIRHADGKKVKGKKLRISLKSLKKHNTSKIN